MAGFSINPGENAVGLLAFSIKSPFCVESNFYEVFRAGLGFELLFIVLVKSYKNLKCSF